MGQTKIKSVGNRRTMGGGRNVWKRITFLGSQTSSPRGLCKNDLVLTQLLQEASLPVSWAAAVSYRSLSASSKAMKTARQLCLVPEAELIKLNPHLHPNGVLGGRAGRLQAAVCCLDISGSRAEYYSWAFVKEPRGTWRSTLVVAST